MASISETPSSGLQTPPTDQETLCMFLPNHPDEIQVEDFINSHPLTLQLRANPNYVEARPHLKIPPGYRNQNLTGGVLLGPGRVVVPPIMFADEGKELISIAFLGTDICGHPGIIHGGMLATILDENLARCCFPALPHKIGVTANLNINYRSPTPAGSYVVFRGTTTKVEGRKAWVEGRIESLVDEGETPVVYVEATALFISPKQAAAMANIYPSK